MRTLNFPSVGEQKVLQILNGRRMLARDVEFELSVLGINYTDIRAMLKSLERRGYVDHSVSNGSTFKYYQTPLGSMLSQFINNHGASSDGIESG
jgi:hypothetical protein